MSALAASAPLRPVWSVFGVPIDPVTLDEAEACVRAAVKSRKRLSFVTPNLNWLMRALKDADAMAQVRQADLSLADGAPIVWLARQLGAPIPERVAGSDLFDRLRLKKLGDPPIRVFFFGGRDGAAETAVAMLNEEAAGCIGCGAINPGYGAVQDMSAPVIIDTINAARPDFVLVALGAAKGQSWIAANQARLEAPVIAHLGAVVDFVAGTVPRAPAWMSRAGLEWVWRIGAEPALFGRYLKDGLSFLCLMWGRLRAVQLDLDRQVPTGVELKVERQGAAISISGDCAGEDSARLVPLVAKLSNQMADAQMDLSGLGALDSAGLGAFARLSGRVSADNRQLVFTGASPAHARLLELSSLAIPHPAHSAPRAGRGLSNIPRSTT